METVIIFVGGAVIVLLLLLITFSVIGKAIEKDRRRDLYIRQRLITDLQKMDPFKFEKYIAAMYEQRGYKTQLTKDGADDGIDIILQGESGKIAVQVKRYKANNKVGAKDMRDFYGAFINNGFASGKFVTLSSFTKPATEWAATRNIELIDGEKIARMMNSY